MTDNQHILADQAEHCLRLPKLAGQPTTREMFECQASALVMRLDRFRALSLSLADRIYKQSELLSRKAERPALILTEVDSHP